MLWGGLLGRERRRHREVVLLIGVMWLLCVPRERFDLEDGGGCAIEGGAWAGSDRAGCTLETLV